MRIAVLFPLFASILLLGCSEKKPAPPVLPDPSTGPTVSYSDLGWDKGLFTWEGEPFTGHATDLHSDGTSVKMEIDISLGKRHGLVQEFTEDGTQIVECTFYNDKQHGNNTYWDTDGNLIKKQVYEHGEELSTEKFGSLAEGKE